MKEEQKIEEISEDIGDEDDPFGDGEDWLDD